MTDAKGVDCVAKPSTSSSEFQDLLRTSLHDFNDITIEDIEEVINTDRSSVPGQCRDTVANNTGHPGAYNSKMEGMPSTSRGVREPHVKILIQPAQKALRFRYECEGRSAGSIPGANSTPENRTFPTIQVMNHSGPAVVVVSCVTKDPPYRPHPHKLVGKDGCKQGLCTMAINNKDMMCSFSNLGIQCVKRKDIEDALKERENIKVDPFRTGFNHKHQAGSIDLNSVRLCFQVFIEGSRRGKFENPLTPVVSEPIFDKKAMCDLVICKLSACSATVLGGTEIILLCEKIVKEDIQICFYEVKGDTVHWEGLGEFQPSDVHKQVAITFKTPEYRDTKVQSPVDAMIQLKRPSDGSLSEPRAFQFLPVDADPDRILEKKRKMPPASFRQYFPENPGFVRGAEARPPRPMQFPHMKTEPMELPCLGQVTNNPFRLSMGPPNRDASYNMMQQPLHQSQVSHQPYYPGFNMGSGSHRMEYPGNQAGPSSGMHPGPDMYMLPDQHMNVQQINIQHMASGVEDSSIPSLPSSTFPVYSVPSSLDATQDQVHPSGCSSFSQSFDLGMISGDLESLMMEIPPNILNSHLSDISGHMSNEALGVGCAARMDYVAQEDNNRLIGEGRQGHDPAMDSLNRLDNEIMELNYAAGGRTDSM